MSIAPVQSHVEETKLPVRSTPGLLQEIMKRDRDRQILFYVAVILLAITTISVGIGISCLRGSINCPILERVMWISAVTSIMLALFIRYKLNKE